MIDGDISRYSFILGLKAKQSGYDKRNILILSQYFNITGLVL